MIGANGGYEGKTTLKQRLEQKLEDVIIDEDLELSLCPDLVLILFDITKEFKAEFPPEMICVGNKADLLSDVGVVRSGVYMVSAKTGQGIQDLIKGIRLSL